MLTVYWVIIGLTLLAMVTPWLLKAIFPHKICFKEVALSMVVSLVIGGISFLVFVSTTPHSIEIWNGLVTDKKQVRVSCSHSYQCHCVNVCTGSGNTRSCTRVCQTCYRHTHDYDWRVFTNLDHYTNISRVDSQGRRTPPRWDKVIVGEPFSKENRYPDYLKASDASIFYTNNTESNEEYDRLIPEYPRVYDVYRSNHVFEASANRRFSDAEIKDMNDHLKTLLGEWGPKYQINMILVFTDQSREFMSYMVNEWEGGRKNDAIIFINVADDNTVNWVDLQSWTKNEFFNSIIRAEILALDEFGIDSIWDILSSKVKYFERIEMEEFSYLLSERKYHWWQILLMLFFQLAGNITIGVLIARNKLFGGLTNSYSSRRMSRLYRR